LTFVSYHASWVGNILAPTLETWRKDMEDWRRRTNSVTVWAYSILVITHFFKSFGTILHNSLPD